MHLRALADEGRCSPVSRRRPCRGVGSPAAAAVGRRLSKQTVLHEEGNQCIWLFSDTKNADSNGCRTPNKTKSVFPVEWYQKHETRRISCEELKDGLPGAGCCGG